MSYFLDTNICIYALKGTYPALRGKLERHLPESIKIPSMVHAELLFGAVNSQNTERALIVLRQFLAPFEEIAFDSRCAPLYAQIRLALEKKGQLIGPNDLIIAATARAHRWTLVTKNLREFSRVVGLKVEDWTV